MTTDSTLRVMSLIGRTNLSKKDFATKCGITPPAFSRSLKNGFSLEYLARIAKAFDEDLDWLRYGQAKADAKKELSVDNGSMAQGYATINTINGENNKGTQTINSSEDDCRVLRERIAMLEEKIALQDKVIADKEEEIKFLRKMLSGDGVPKSVPCE